MKRDLALCTKILMALEELPPCQGWNDLEFKGVDQTKLSYHIKILNEIYLIDAIDISSIGNFEWKAKDLTWQGHDFLEKTRENTWINKIKKKAIKKGVDIAFAAIEYKLAEYMKIPMV